MLAVYWLENPMGIDHLEELDIEWRIILEWILGEKCGKVWTESMWLRIGRSSWLL
jgi:hypothetical protein